MNNQEKIKRILKIVTDKLTENKIKYWLDYGSLLGAVREEKMIGWDEDADISCLKKDKEKIKKVIEEIDNVFLKVSFEGTGFQVMFPEDKETKTHLDIFLWYEDGEFLRREHYIDLDKKTGTDVRKGKDFLKEWVEELKEVNFGEHKYFVSREAEKFCEFRYGKLWKKPMSVYEWNQTKPEENLIIKLKDNRKYYE
jgi:phosphorylcholine metabolism protein LicD